MQPRSEKKKIRTRYEKFRKATTSSQIQAIHFQCRHSYITVTNIIPCSFQIKNFYSSLNFKYFAESAIKFTYNWLCWWKIQQKSEFTLPNRSFWKLTYFTGPRVHWPETKPTVAKLITLRIWQICWTLPHQSVRNNVVTFLTQFLSINILKGHTFYVDFKYNKGYNKTIMYIYIYLVRALLRPHTLGPLMAHSTTPFLLYGQNLSKSYNHAKG